MYALLGKTLKHSISPEIHAEIFSEIGIAAEYKLLECTIDDLPQIIARGDYQGLNVTIPYKEEVLQYIDYIDPAAQQIQAINTIAYIDGKICGYNTDYTGFSSLLLKNKIMVQGKKVVILGVGGSAKMVAAYMCNQGAQQVYLVSRNPATKVVATQAKIIDYRELETIERADIIVNTTPCGMYPNIADSAVSRELLKNFQVAIDLIYNPTETVFLRDAREQGLQTVNGLYMLVAQAVHAQEIWQQVKLETAIIERIAKKMQVYYEK